MSIEERNEIKKQAYNEALRYIDNAEDNLRKAKKEGKYYSDPKYVRTASGIAYNAVLLALDALFEIKGINGNAKNRKSIDWYCDHLRKMDWKLLNDVNTVYDILHLNGYYEGLTNVKAIDAGMESALSVIKKIKPVVN